MTNIYTALASFQSEVKPIAKNTKGYNYKYADLGSIIEYITPLLAKHGLGFYQPLDGKSVKTIVFHIESGDTVESSIDIPQDVELGGMNAYQSLGSAITYLRRYSLASLLGLITDEDTDASGEQVRTINQVRR
jgi:hypothetical protein